MNQSSLLRKSNASALITCLLFITLIAILLLGFLSGTKLEIPSAELHLNGEMAQLYARAGTDTALARLREATAPAGFWIAHPGKIHRFTKESPDLIPHDLSSGLPPEDARPEESVDLNVVRVRAETKSLIMPETSPMRVRWLYLLKDGSIRSDSYPEYSKDNPAIGRFAFWTDDECGKININTAWTRAAQNKSSLSHVSRINLVSLFGDETDAVQTFRKERHPFHATEQITEVSATIAGKAREELFNLTHYNRTPDRNIFGEPRIILTVNAELAGGDNCIDILKTPGLDPGLIDNLSPTKVAKVVEKLAAIFRRTDWPYKPGQSFESKFAPVPAEQLALNIVEYVRARESKQAVVEPISGRTAGGPFVMTLNSNSNYSINPVWGNNRGPRITEIGVYIPAAKKRDSQGDHFDALFKVKLHLPSHCGLEKLDLSAFTLLTQVYPIDTVYGKERIGQRRNYIEGGDPILRAGEYKVVVNNVRINVSERPTSIDLRAGLINPANDRVLEIAPVLRGPSLEIPQVCLHYVVDPDSTPENKISSYAVDDPSLNKHRDCWQRQAQNTFGQLRSSFSSLGRPSTASPQQDTESSGVVTDAGLVFPPPAGTAPAGQLSNLSGTVESVAELGFIHTGLICFSANGTPWRSFRLQPKKETASLPDWALLDMFSAPPASSPSYYEKGETGLGGRIGLNAAIEPFSQNPDTAISRVKPLQAVFDKATEGTTPLTAERVELIVQHILAGTLATGANPGNNYGFDRAFVSRGQIAEIQDVADRGESSELLLHGPVDLLTTQSSVFSICSIGQSIRQHPNGVTVLAERRTRTMVERRETSGAPQFHTVYSVDLKP